MNAFLRQASKMANNNFIKKNISQESCSSDQDAISLYYDGDSLISGQKSRESMSSIDEFIATSQYESGFKVLLNQEMSYAVALKQLIKSIGDIQSNVDFVVRKILNKHNDDVFAFFTELKAIENSGYKFDIVMVNLLMENCVQKYNMDFHHFIQTRIINKMTKAEMDQLNQNIFDRFVKVRLGHVAQQRYLGLPRTIRKSKQ